MRRSSHRGRDALRARHNARSPRIGSPHTAAMSRGGPNREEMAAAFIVSANLARRSLSKGQQAMALAMIYPEPERGGRGNEKERVEEISTPFSAKRLQQARKVLHHSRALAEDVLADRKKLDEALKIVAQENERAAKTDSQMAELQAGEATRAPRITRRSTPQPRLTARPKLTRSSRPEKRRPGRRLTSAGLSQAGCLRNRHNP